MNTASLLKHFLNDEASLQGYIAEQVATFDDVKRRVFLLERLENRSLPDHHYRLLNEQSFININSISEIFTKGLPDLAINMLEIKGSQIQVKLEQQHIWQEHLTFIPPLLMKSTLLWRNGLPNWNDISKIRDYFNNLILPNFRYTALPSPSLDIFDELMLNGKGFNDLHMHLNGSTETDVAWQDYISFPDKIYTELEEDWNHERVKELLEQESSLLDPKKFRKLLMVGKRVRWLLFDLIYNQQGANSRLTLSKILKKIFKLNEVIEEDNIRHPFAVLVGGHRTDDEKLALEALMIIRVVDHISSYPDSNCVSLLHIYILILGLCNRLLVQQTHQFGFEQFQKITLNKLREFSEIEYASRFHQIQGNDLRHFGFLEGRFSPKENEHKLVGLLSKINNGWQNMLDTFNRSNSGQEQLPELSLVAHFIKRIEGKDVHPYIRHRWLRNDIWNRGKVLAILLKNNAKYKKIVTGIDAASSEFDAPPEVFAPLFRMLRRMEIKNFTYHAGEDFHHLISGLRAVFEVIEFMEMEPSNRIGHAVATGLSPKLWLSSIGKRLLIRQGEWLDNLIFIQHLIDEYTDGQLDYLKKILPSEINKLAKDVYKIDASLEQLKDAWLCRKYEPMLLLANDREEAKVYSVYDASEWEQIKKEKISNEVKELIKRYNHEKYRAHYEHIIEIIPDELLSARALEICQKAVLKLMARRSVVIETLPTSNVRIGHHRNFETYHLWNWLKMKKNKHEVPPIVVGTDDTGIFATNILNEYANIYLHLADKQSKAFAEEIVKELKSNSAKYRFV